MGDVQDSGWLTSVLTRFSKNRKRALDFDFEVRALYDGIIIIINHY